MISLLSKELKSFLQLHSSKASILRRSAFVMGLFIYLSIHLGHAVQLEACGILVPRSWFEPWPSAVKARRPNHWTTREVPPGRSKSRPDGIPLPNLESGWWARPSLVCQGKDEGGAVGGLVFSLPRSEPGFPRAPAAPEF